MEKNWNSWRWQMSHRIRSLEQISACLKLTEDEKIGIEMVSNSEKWLRMNITPYYFNLININNIEDPIRKMVVPRAQEFDVKKWESDDPIGEEKRTVVEGLVHRYPDRVLLLVTDQCASYCRYCTRRRLVGKRERVITWSKFGEVIEYLKKHEEVRDIVISGGDPLVLENERLERILKALRGIKHIEILRIGTKVPIVLPQRITPSLCNMLKKYHPLYMSINIAHPNEITEEAAIACERLVMAGIPLGSQTVLLKGINDNVETMKELMQKLLKIRVKPYYIYQCDLVKGIEHFRTPVMKGLEILEGLRGWTSGYAVPTFVVDTPGGKVPLSPNYIKAWNSKKLEIRTYKGKIFEYWEIE